MNDNAAHLTIGEVLSLVKDEFPDVTISKIRFLESQGLIEPQRTSSGYRKFYEDDVTALRWVLRQQRDNFLPLKVIKAKMSDGGDQHDEGDVQQGLFGGSADAPPARTSPADPPPTLRSSTPDTANATPAEGASDNAAADADAGDPAPAAARRGRATQGDDVARSGEWLAQLQESPEGIDPPPHRPAPSRPLPAPGLRFGRAEVLELTGVEGAALDQMIEYGLVETTRVGGEITLDASALAVVRAVCAFSDRGLESRHLRAFKNGADREAGLIEQLILPLLKQRNPKAREQAVAQLAELRGFSDELHRALTDQALRAYFG